MISLFLYIINMRKKENNKASSVQQRKLMGWAYAWASGKTEKAPSSIKKIAKSFTKKNKKKGLKSLRSFAKTKHDNLPLYKENIIIKFDQFLIESSSIDVINFLKSLNDDYVNDMIDKLINSDNSEEKEESIQNIILEMGDKLDDEKYNWVVNELEKKIKQL